MITPVLHKHGECFSCSAGLTFNESWYLDLSAWFMKNVTIIWTEKDKIMK